MPDVLELAPLDVSRLHRQARGGTFQRLDAGHLIDRDGLHALVGGGLHVAGGPRRGASLRRAATPADVAASCHRRRQ